MLGGLMEREPYTDGLVHVQNRACRHPRALYEHMTLRIAIDVKLSVEVAKLWRAHC
jgi:hypothetical protein